MPALAHRRLVVVAVLLLASVAGADDTTPTTADDHIAALRQGMKDRRRSDSLEKENATLAVVGAIDQLTAAFATYDERTQRDVVRAVAGVLAVWTDEDDAEVHYAAAAALSDMGPPGAEALRNTRGVSHLDRNVDVRRILIQALGKHRDPADVDYFVKLLADDDTRIVNAGAAALAEYFDADATLRKKIARAVLKEYLKAHRDHEKSKGNDAAARERLLAIEVGMNQALDRMTAQNLQSAPEWDAWLKAHINEDW